MSIETSEKYAAVYSGIVFSLGDTAEDAVRESLDLASRDELEVAPCTKALVDMYDRYGDEIEIATDRLKDGTFCTREEGLDYWGIR